MKNKCTARDDTSSSSAAALRDEGTPHSYPQTRGLRYLHRCTQPQRFHQEHDHWRAAGRHGSHHGLCVHATNTSARLGTPPPHSTTKCDMSAQVSRHRSRRLTKKHPDHVENSFQNNGFLKPSHDLRATLLNSTPCSQKVSVIQNIVPGADASHFTNFFC